MVDNYDHSHDPKIKKNLRARLKRIEGQIRGISKMIEQDLYCQEILNQFASVKSALNGARDLLLKDHIQNCIADKMQKNQEQATEELIEIIKKISKF